jgi:hypothetical protein
MILAYSGLESATASPRLSSAPSHYGLAEVEELVRHRPSSPGRGDCSSQPHERPVGIDPTEQKKKDCCWSRFESLLFFVGKPTGLDCMRHLNMGLGPKNRATVRARHAPITIRLSALSVHRVRRIEISIQRSATRTNKVHTIRVVVVAVAVAIAVHLDSR